MTRPSDLPPELAREPFRVAAALELGVHPERLRRRDLAKPFHGARALRPPQGIAERAAALVPLLGAHQAFCGMTAARLWGMRLPQRPPSDALHVVSFGAARAMRRPGVLGRSASGVPDTAQAPGGIPATTTLRTWIDLAAECTADELVAVGDGLVARRNPMAALDDLGNAVAEAGPVRGAARLRAALPRIRVGTDSWQETITRLVLARGGVAEPECNRPIRAESGEIVAHGDMVWPEERVIVEYEGRQHWEDAWQFSVDLRRYRWLEALGWTVVRVDKHLLSDVPALLATVRAALDRATRSRSVG